MYERMLDKRTAPTMSEMTAYCGANAELFAAINEWLSAEYDTAQQIVFPYGNKYGWGVAHKKKSKLVCNVFAEDGSFTVMLRLSNPQFDALYDSVGEYTREHIDRKYPCGGGGWIHYRVTCKQHFEDIQKLLSAKCA